MNSLRFLVLTLALLFGMGTYAQDNRALITIEGEDVTVDDFMYVYKKNNNEENAMSKKSIEEYLDLYINFKLKVKEAENEGLDTVQAFVDELAGYRKQLAEPYFVNDEIMGEMLKEAYERKKYDIRASHILFKVSPNAMPEDTMMAWNKAIEARKRINDGEDFAEVAKALSEDPSARDREGQRGGRMIPGNGGDLGYFSVFDMVYPFETGAYNLEIGEVSMPVRSDFGYHIIKLTDKIPAQGSIEAAHLYLQMPENATSTDSAAIEEEAMQLYTRINEGEIFEDLVKEYSDDKGSAARGGVLPKFNVNRMVPEFIAAISHMSDSGDISKPVLTSYGWHIVKLISKSGLAPFDEVKDDMEKRLEKDRRAQKSTEVIIRDIKNEYGYKEYRKNLEKVYDLMDSTIYQSAWAVAEDVELNKPVISLGDAKYTQQMFVDFIIAKQNIGQQENFKEFINKKFKEFSDEKCKDYEDSKLEEKYPEFKAIVKEYRDGILLFELTNEKIWSYAGKDTVGLQNYYNEHKKDFMWDTRLDASIVSVMDTNYIDQVRALAEAGNSDDEILAEINADSLDVVRIERKKFQKEENDLIDEIKWKKGITDNKKDKGRTIFVVVHGKVSPEPKTFDEARGLITAGYQEYLEEQWIEELRGKYSVEVHEDVLETIVE